MASCPLIGVEFMQETHTHRDLQHAHEHLAVNETIAEGEEDDGSAVTPLEEKPATPRTRNRPKREVEPSSK
uniref:Uncharacterized protein n=1 Tax=Solanum tuberosum TaxID=4113 RepID=M1A8U2_SOLTU